MHCDVIYRVKDCERVNMFVADLRMIATTDRHIDSMEDHSLTTDLDFDDYMQPPTKQNEIPYSGKFWISANFCIFCMMARHTK